MVHHDFQTRSKQILAAAALTMACVLPAHAQDNQEVAAVRSQYDAATALFTQRDYKGARLLLLEIWEQRKTADVATMLGQIEIKLEHHAEAAKYLAFAVANFPPTESVKRAEIIRGWLADEKKRVVTCEVFSTPEGALVSVDGVDAGVTPLAAPLFMDPGRHIVALRKDGFKIADRSINASAGTSETWSATLVPVESAPRTNAETPKIPVKQQPVTPPPDLPAPATPSPWIMVGGSVVTLGALASALVFELSATSEYDKARSLRSELESSSCSGATAASLDACSSILNHAKKGDRDRNLETVSFAVAGAVAIGTLTYWFWPRSNQSTRSSRITLDGTVSKQLGTLSLSAAF